MCYAGHEASPFTDPSPCQIGAAEAEVPRDWVVHDMTRPDHENPAFGPMTEAQKNDMMRRSQDEGGKYDYWAQRIS